MATPSVGLSHGYLEGVDGLRLHFQCWEARAPRAVLLVSPGLGEHSGRYAALAADLAPRGISTYALDHRGHGLSEGRRGHVARFAEFVQDLERFRREVATTAPGDLPVFLLGHSLGGLIALRYLQEIGDTPLRGAILTSPLLGVAVEAPRWLVAISGLLSRVLPALPFASRIDPGLLTRDPAGVEAYRRDPLVHARVTPRLYTEMTAAIGDAFAARERVRVPLLFLVSGEDRIARPEKALELARGLPGDVTVRDLEGMYHECLNEVGREDVVDEVADWILARTGDAAI